MAKIGFPLGTLHEDTLGVLRDEAEEAANFDNGSLRAVFSGFLEALEREAELRIVHPERTITGFEIGTEDADQRALRWAASWAASFWSIHDRLGSTAAAKVWYEVYRALARVRARMEPAWVTIAKLDLEPGDDEWTPDIPPR